MGWGQGPALLADAQTPQPHVLERLLLPCCLASPLWSTGGRKRLGLFLDCQFCSGSLCVCRYEGNAFEVRFGIGKRESSEGALLQHCFWLFGIHCNSYEFKYELYHLQKQAFRFWECIESVLAWGSIVWVTPLSSGTWRQKTFCSFVSFVSFSSILSRSVYLFHTFLNLVK